MLQWMSVPRHTSPCVKCSMDVDGVPSSQLLCRLVLVACDAGEFSSEDPAPEAGLDVDDRGVGDSTIVSSGGRGGNTGWPGPLLNGAVETGDVEKVVDAPDLLSELFATSVFSCGATLLQLLFVGGVDFEIPITGSEPGKESSEGSR